jgi:Stress responsive A/B Barrel Domain
MIRHVVFFKFKPEVSSANRTAVLNQLRALPDKIDVIRSFEVGEDVLHSARSWDAVLIATYDDLQALDIYTRHDDHVEVVLKLREICDAVGSVDFEY